MTSGLLHHRITRIAMRGSNRRADHLHLLVLARVQAGETMGAIGTSLGKSEAYARVIINRIRTADLAESGEPKELVAKSYPPIGGGARA